MSGDSQIAIVTARLDALERRHRRLRNALIAAAAALASIAAAQAVASKPVASNRYFLLDEEARTRAELAMSAPGSGRAGVNPILSFSDEQGRVRVRIGLGQRGPTLETIDEGGKTHEYFGGPAIRPATQ